MKKIGVIGGGFSSEYHISLKSTQTIIDNFPHGYTPIKIVLSKDGCRVQWDGDMHEIDLTKKVFFYGKQRIEIDAYWIYIHGDPGENGRLQASLEMYNIPYIGSQMLPSALSFDKWYCNQFLKNFGVPIAKSVHLFKNQSFDKSEILRQIAFPMFIKPTASGSSYGISKVYSEENIDQAIETAFQQGEQIVIESFLDGLEVTCAVYQSENGIQTLPLAEIVSENDFFDYEAKYLGKSQEIIPARISEELTQQINELSIKIYALMQLRSVVRIDFMIVDGIAHLIEINTTPGFSSASLVPQMIEKQQRSIRDFLTEILIYELKY